MDKFLITITPMYKDHHIHGCNRAALLRLAQDKTVCFETKGSVASAGWCTAMSADLFFFFHEFMIPSLGDGR